MGARRRSSWRHHHNARRSKPPSTVLHGLPHHIDAVIENNPTATVTAVWEHLVNDLDATVSYGAVRAYVARQRSERR